CEIVYRFLRANDMAIDKKIATCLLAGIFADTWGFRHPNTTSATLEVVAELLLKGAFVNKIARTAHRRNAASHPKIWSRALEKVIIEKNSGFVFCILGQDDLKECGASADDVSGLASLLCMIPGIKFSLVLKEFVIGEIDGSFRALPSGGVDVAGMARALGGGGHKLAAGFKSKRPAEEVIKQVRDLIKQG
ncbi:MAG: DHHA1 domain-containing protein, partial [bacterium]